jgi:hypothetical protein
MAHPAFKYGILNTSRTGPNYLNFQSHLKILIYFKHLTVLLDYSNIVEINNMNKPKYY